MIHVSNRSFKSWRYLPVDETLGTRIVGYLKRNALVIVVVVVLMLVVLVAPRWAFDQVLNLMQATGDLMARLTAAFRPVFARVLDNVFLRVLVYMAPLWLWVGGEIVAYIRNPGIYSISEAMFKRDGIFSITITLALISMILVCGAPFVYMSVGLGSILVMLLPVLRSYQVLMTARNLTELAQIGAHLKITEAELTKAEATGQDEISIEVPDFNSTGLQVRFWTRWVRLVTSLIVRLIIGLVLCYGFPLVCTV